MAPGFSLVRGGLTPWGRFLLFLLGIGIACAVLDLLITNAPSGPAASASSYFAWFGIIAVGLLWLISGVFAGDWNPLALAMGMDNRLSTSKLQALLWTGTVGFVYATLYANRVITHGYVGALHSVPPNVLIALGISATSVVAAKAITSSQVASNPQAKGANDSPSYDPSALVSDDGAPSVSLTKVQLLFWTAIAIIVYIVTAMHRASALASCAPQTVDSGDPNCSLPDIDTTLMIFMGLGHATYLGGKLAGSPSPILTSARQSVGQDGRERLTLGGANLGSAGAVLVNGTEVQPINLSWTPTSVTMDLPSKPDGSGWKAGDAVGLSVNVAGVPSQTISFQYTPTSRTAGTRSLPTMAAPVAVIRQVPPVAARIASPSKTSLAGIDVSYAQGVIDWDAVKSSSLASFVYARASYGSNPADDDGNIFRRNHDECKRLGIWFGAYHFFLFGQSGLTQANHFLQQINGRYGTVRAMVDVEEGSGTGDSQAQMIANLSQFVAEAERTLGAPMIIYTNADTWNNKLGGSNAFRGHQLWVCNFTGDPSIAPAMPLGFDDWTLYQYADNGTIPVLDGPKSRAVDLDVLRGGISSILRVAAV